MDASSSARKPQPREADGDLGMAVGQVWPTACSVRVRSGRLSVGPSCSGAAGASGALAGINEPMNQPTSTPGSDDLSCDVWTMDDVIAFLRVTPAQVRRLMGVDETFPVPAQVSPRVWRWERAAVQEWLRSGSATRPRGVTSETRSIVERV